MHHDRATSADVADPDGGLIDLTGLDLGDLDAADQSCLAEALRRLCDAQSQSAEVVAGFQEGPSPTA
jgi:FXSXX-COOH protein